MKSFSNRNIIKKRVYLYVSSLLSRSYFFFNNFSISVGFDNRWMFYTTTPRIPSPFFGYDNMLAIQRKGFKFIVSKNVVGEHTSKQTRDYTRLRYGQSGKEVKEIYKRFMKKWRIRVSRRLWLKIMFPRRFPLLWGLLREVRALS